LPFRWREGKNELREEEEIERARDDIEILARSLASLLYAG
jgi:hypothetical protein